MAPGTAQAASDRPELDVQDLGDFSVVHPFNIAEHDDGPLRLLQ
jgi:hypothetical protein